MNLQDLAPGDSPTPALVAGGSLGQRYAQTLATAKDWSSGNVLDWGQSRIMMSDQPTEGQVALKDIRSALKLHAADRQAVLLNLDGIGVEAQNALLKTLEEPPSQTWILLLCSHLHYVLPTIRSRCQLFSIKAMDQNQVEQWISQSGLQIEPGLREKCGLNPELLQWAADHPDWAGAADHGDFAALLAAIRAAEQPAYHLGHMIRLLQAGGYCQAYPALDLLNSGTKPEAVLALACLG